MGKMFLKEFLHQHLIISVYYRHIMRPLSKAESHMSLATSRRGPSVIRGDYLSADEDVPTAFMYPHLQVCLIIVAIK